MLFRKIIQVAIDVYPVVRRTYKKIFTDNRHYDGLLFNLCNALKGHLDTCQSAGSTPEQVQALSDYFVAYENFETEVRDRLSTGLTPQLEKILHSMIEEYGLKAEAETLFENLLAEVDLTCLGPALLDCIDKPYSHLFFQCVFDLIDVDSVLDKPSFTPADTLLLDWLKPIDQKLSVVPSVSDSGAEWGSYGRFNQALRHLSFVRCSSTYSPVSVQRAPDGAGAAGVATLCVMGNWAVKSQLTEDLKPRIQLYFPYLDDAESQALCEEIKEWHYRNYVSFVFDRESKLLKLEILDFFPPLQHLISRADQNACRVRLNVLNIMVRPEVPASPSVRATPDVTDKRQTVDETELKDFVSRQIESLEGQIESVDVYATRFLDSKLFSEDRRRVVEKCVKPFLSTHRTHEFRLKAFLYATTQLTVLRHQQVVVSKSASLTDIVELRAELSLEIFRSPLFFECVVKKLVSNVNAALLKREEELRVLRDLEIEAAFKDVVEIESAHKFAKEAFCSALEDYQYNSVTSLNFLLNQDGELFEMFEAYQMQADKLDAELTRLNGLGFSDCATRLLVMRRSLASLQAYTRNALTRFFTKAVPHVHSFDEDVVRDFLSIGFEFDEALKETCLLSLTESVEAYNAARSELFMRQMILASLFVLFVSTILAAGYYNLIPGMYPFLKSWNDDGASKILSFRSGYHDFKPYQTAQVKQFSELSGREVLHAVPDATQYWLSNADFTGYRDILIATLSGFQQFPFRVILQEPDQADNLIIRGKYDAERSHFNGQIIMDLHDGRQLTVSTPFAAFFFDPKQALNTIYASKFDVSTSSADGIVRIERSYKGTEPDLERGETVGDMVIQVFDNDVERYTVALNAGFAGSLASYFRSGIAVLSRGGMDLYSIYDCFGDIETIMDSEGVFVDIKPAPLDSVLRYRSQDGQSEFFVRGEGRLNPTGTFSFFEEPEVGYFPNRFEPQMLPMLAVSRGGVEFPLTRQFGYDCFARV